MDVISLFGLSADSPRLEEALTHPSFAHEVRGQLDNQRLEFLGDAVLDFLTSRILFDRFPRADEGELTRRRALLVSTEALAHFARHHGLGQAIRFGRGAVMSSLEESDNVLADALEALLAATYLDHGLTAAEKACEKIVDHGIALAGGSAALDPKSELQRQVQAKGLRAPTYDVLRQEGPAHETIFEVVVLVEGREVGRGTGRSKKTAERAAAQNALDLREGEASGSLSDQAEGQA